MLFQECSINGIIQEVTFWNWLFLLSIIHWKFDLFRLFYVPIVPFFPVLRIFFFIVVKKHLKYTILTIFKYTGLVTYIYIHIIVQQIPRTFSSCETEILYPLNSPTFPSPSGQRERERES